MLKAEFKKCREKAGLSQQEVATKAGGAASWAQCEPNRTEARPPPCASGGVGMLQDNSGDCENPTYNVYGWVSRPDP